MSTSTPAPFFPSLLAFSFRSESCARSFDGGKRRDGLYNETKIAEGQAMSAPTVPISESSHQILKVLAEQTGQTVSEVLDKALAAYRRQLFFEQLNAGYAELRADPKAWAEHLAERKLWDATLMDGLDPDEHWTEDGRALAPDQP
jgi:hypothetical protein